MAAYRDNLRGPLLGVLPVAKSILRLYTLDEDAMWRCLELFAYLATWECNLAALTPEVGLVHSTMLQHTRNLHVVSAGMTFLVRISRHVGRASAALLAVVPVVRRACAQHLADARLTELSVALFDQVDVPRVSEALILCLENSAASFGGAGARGPEGGGWLSRSALFERNFVGCVGGRGPVCDRPLGCGQHRRLWLVRCNCRLVAAPPLSVLWWIVVWPLHCEPRGYSNGLHFSATSVSEVFQTHCPRR